MVRQSLCLVLVLAISLSPVASDIGFPIETGNVDENSSINIEFGQFGPDNSLSPAKTIYCRAKIDDSSNAVIGADYTWSHNGNQINDVKYDFQLKHSSIGGPEQITFSVHAILDAAVDLEEFINLHVNCFSGPDMTPFEAIVMNNCLYKLKISNTQITDDPHFFQNVLGLDEHGKEISENICYDLVGVAGDIYELLTDDILKISILCRLRDDYYMGEIRIKTPTDVFIANTDVISLEGHFTRSWSDIQKYEMGQNPLISVESINGRVQVVYKENNRKIAIRVERVMQEERGKNYLNFFIEETSEKGDVVFDKYHGGLFGVAANNKYQFTKPVQEKGGIANVQINERTVNAYRQVSPTTNVDCYLLNLEDVVAPYTKNKFMKTF